MSVLLLLTALLLPGDTTLTAPLTATPYELNLDRPLERGLSWQYRGDLMESVARRRGLGWIKGIKGFVSVPDCQHLGDLVYARIGPRRGWWRVVDCSRTKDRPSQRRKRLIIEASGKIAVLDGWDHYLLDGPGHAPAAIYGYKEVFR